MPTVCFTAFIAARNTLSLSALCRWSCSTYVRLSELATYGRSDAAQRQEEKRPEPSKGGAVEGIDLVFDRMQTCSVSVLSVGYSGRFAR